jgi:hypothetical protein
MVAPPREYFNCGMGITPHGCCLIPKVFSANAPLVGHHTDHYHGAVWFIYDQALNQCGMVQLWSSFINGLVPDKLKFSDFIYALVRAVLGCFRRFVMASGN